MDSLSKLDKDSLLRLIDVISFFIDESLEVIHKYLHDRIHL